MTKEELEKIFRSEFATADNNGNLVVSGTTEEIVAWIAKNFCKPAGPPFAKAFTGMHDKNGKPIHEGDDIKIYYKGEYFVCRVIYDVKHAAFFIKWADGYINHYFMNGSAYEVINEK
jgi:hypothetical protein